MKTNPATSDPAKILVFGGAFNPPTNAHAQIIQACLEAPEFSEVWVMPSGDRYDKQMATDDRHRLDMLRLIKRDQFGDNPRLKVTDFELELPRPSETIRTVGALALAHPDTDFWFVFGADSYASMPQWQGGLALQAELSVALLPRGDIELPPENEQIVHLPDIATDTAAVSSTQVREALSIGNDIRHFVCNAVHEYIQQRALYTA